MSRARVLVRGVVAAVLVLLASACVAPGAPGGDDAAGQPFRVGVHAPTLVSLDPNKVLRTGSQSIVWAVYSRLTQIDDTGRVVPDLATAWTQSSPTEWVFTLRDDAVFENGVRLDAGVVVWNLERILDPATGATVANGWNTLIASAVAVDPTTVRITTTTPFVTLPNALSTVFYLEPSWAQANNPAVAALGSGPYRLVSYAAENRGVLERSDTYYGEAPALERVEVVGYGESATRIAALKNGEIDATITIDPVELPDLRTRDTLEVGGAPGQRVQTLQLNFNVPQFRDVRVRQALNYAIDRERITASIYGGTTEPNHTQVISKHYAGYDASAPVWPYDLEQARRLLAEAGVGPFEVDVNVPTATYAGAEQAIQVIAESWASLGITLKIGVLPSGPWGDRNTTKDPAAAPDIIYWGAQNPNLDPLRNLQHWTSDYRTNDGALPEQGDYDALYAAATQATSPEELRERVGAASAWLRANAALVYLWDQPQTYAYDEGLGWRPRFDDWIDFVHITPQGGR